MGKGGGECFVVMSYCYGSAFDWWNCIWHLHSHPSKITQSPIPFACSKSNMLLKIFEHYEQLFSGICTLFYLSCSYEFQVAFKTPLVTSLLLHADSIFFVLFQPNFGLILSLSNIYKGWIKADTNLRFLTNIWKDLYIIN